MRYEPMREYELESIKREIAKALSSGNTSAQSASDAKRKIESAVEDLKRALSSLERNTDSRIRELQSASSSRSSYSSYESGIRDGRREADRAVSKIGDQLRNFQNGMGYGYSYSYSSGEDASRKLDILVDALKKANSELQAAGCQIDKLSNENDGLKRKIGGLGSDMAKVAAGAAMASATQANSELQAASRQIDKLTNENNALKRKVEELGLDIAKMSARTASSSASWQQEMRSGRCDKLEMPSDETIHDEDTESSSSDSRSSIKRRNVVVIDHKIKDLIKQYEREISELRRENAHIKNQKPWFTRLLLIVLVVGAIIYFKDDVMLAVSHGIGDKTDVKLETEAGPSIAKELGVQRFFDCDIGSKLGEEDGVSVMDDGIYCLERPVSLEHPFRACKRMCCFYTAGEKLLFKVVIESKVFANPKVDKMRERLKEISDSLGLQLNDKAKMAETELGYKGVFRPGTEQMLTAEIVGDKTEDGKDGKKIQIKLVDYRILQNDFQENNGKHGK